MPHYSTDATVKCLANNSWSFCNQMEERQSRHEKGIVCSNIATIQNTNTPLTWMFPLVISHFTPVLWILSSTTFSALPSSWSQPVPHSHSVLCYNCWELYSTVLNSSAITNISFPSQKPPSSLFPGKLCPPRWKGLKHSITQELQYKICSHHYISTLNEACDLSSWVIVPSTFCFTLGISFILCICFMRS